VRWETKQTFDGQLYQKYLYQNLLKKFGVFFMPNSLLSDSNMPVVLGICLFLCYFCISPSVFFEKFVFFIFMCS